MSEKPEIPKYSRISMDPNFAPYSEEIKELAFELWCFECGRNYAATARKLKSYLDELVREDKDILSYYELNHTGEVGSMQLRTWGKARKWPEMATERINSIMPQIRLNTMREFFMGLPDAIRGTREISRGEFHDAKAAAVQLKANEIIFDRTGFTPRQDTELPAPSTVRFEMKDLEEMSIEKLMELDESIRDAEYQVIT